MLNKRPFMIFVLFLLLLLQSIGALFGGISLIFEPDGSSLEMTTNILKDTGFSSFLFPGIVLTLLLGIFPLFTFFVLVFDFDKPWMNALNIYPDKMFGWTYAIYTGIMMILWISVQIAIIGYWGMIQSIYSFLGVAIIIVALLPSVMNYYVREHQL